MLAAWSDESVINFIAIRGNRRWKMGVRGWEPPFRCGRMWRALGQVVCKWQLGGGHFSSIFIFITSFNFNCNSDLSALPRSERFFTLPKHAFAIRFDLDQCAAWSRPLKSIEKTRMFWESLSPCPGKGDELRMWTSWVACVATGKWSVWEKCWDNLRFVMLEWPLTFGLAGNAFPGFFAYENPTSNGRKSIELNP